MKKHSIDKIPVRLLLTDTSLNCAFCITQTEFPHIGENESTVYGIL